MRVLATRYGEALRRYGLRRVTWQQIIDLHLYGILLPSTANRSIVELELDYKYRYEWPPFLETDTLGTDTEFLAIQRELNRGKDYELQRKGVPLSTKLSRVLAVIASTLQYR